MVKLKPNVVKKFGVKKLNKIMSIKGQIVRGSVLGEKIYNLCRQPDVKTIVEIGTWQGMGSTKCIYDAVAGTRKEVFSLECNSIRHEEAKVNLGFLPPNFHLILGTVINAEDIAPLRESLSDGLKVWLDEDMSWMRQIPNVVDQLPKEIDVLIIDGGEFTGKMEFDFISTKK